MMMIQSNVNVYKLINEHSISIFLKYTHKLREIYGRERSLNRTLKNALSSHFNTHFSFFSTHENKRAILTTKFGMKKIAQKHFFFIEWLDNGLNKYSKCTKDWGIYCKTFNLMFDFFYDKEMEGCPTWFEWIDQRYALSKSLKINNIHLIKHLQLTQ